MQFFPPCARRKSRITNYKKKREDKSIKKAINMQPRVCKMQPRRSADPGFCIPKSLNSLRSIRCFKCPPRIFKHPTKHTTKSRTYYFSKTKIRYLRLRRSCLRWEVPDFETSCHVRKADHPPPEAWGGKGKWGKNNNNKGVVKSAG